MPQIDIQAALKDGYSPTQIIDGMRSAGMLADLDIDAARKDGHSDDVILGGIAPMFAAQPEQPESKSGDVARGFSTAFKQLPQLGYGLAAGAGAVAEKVVGEGGIATDIKQAGIEGFNEWGDKIQADSKESDSLTYSWDKAKAGDFGALVDWMQYGLGYAGGQAVQMLATAGVGSLVGRATLGTVAKSAAEGMVKKEAALLAAGGEVTEAVTKQAVANVAAKIGQTTAIGATAFGMEGGEIYGDLVSSAEAEGRDLSGAELAKAFGATVAAGGLEFVGDKIGLDLMLGKGVAGTAGFAGRTARAAAGATAGAAIEGGTEYAQTLIEEAGKGNDAFSEDSLRGAFDAAGLGVIGGAAMGGGGGLMAKPVQPAAEKTPEQVADQVLSGESLDDAIAAASELLDEVTPEPAAPQRDFGAMSQGETGFGAVSELGDFAAQERVDLETRRAALAEQQAQANALRLESELETTDGRVAGAQAQQERAKRLDLLDGIYANEQERTPGMTFLAALEQQFPNDPLPTPEEKAIIAQRENAYQAFKAMPNDDGVTTADLGVPEKAAKTEQERTLAQKIAQVDEYLAGGFTPAAGGKKLVNGKGKTLFLNVAQREYLKSLPQATTGMAATSPEVGQPAAPIQPAEEQSNGTDIPAATTSQAPDMRDAVPSGGEVRTPAGTGGAVATDAVRPAAVDDQLAAGQPQRAGDAAGADARVSAGAGGAAVAPEFGTNSAGKITLRGVPMEQIKAVRDKLGAKGWIIGKESAVFPGGTKLDELKREFGVQEAPPMPKQRRPQRASSDLLQRIKQLGGTEEKLPDGTFLDPSLPVNTGVAARMVVIEKGEGEAPLASRAPSAKSGTAQTETPEFKRWFGDSKVVDADGKPLVVYHGTKADFSKFANADGSASNATDVAGFHFSDNPDTAAMFAGTPGEGAQNLIPVYVSLKNPLVQWNRPNLSDAEEARQKGHDGIIGGQYGDMEIVAFRPEQIKSAIGNNGQFDPSNPDIRASFAGERAQTADAHALTTAQSRINAGEDAETVRRETGWFKGADGKWRFEIDDSDAKLKKPWPSKGQLFGDIFDIMFKKQLENEELKGFTVGDVLDHPTLFAAYPELADIALTDQRESGASYSPKGIDPATVRIGRNEAMADVASKLLHELQHAIQHGEEFATGGTIKGQRQTHSAEEVRVLENALSLVRLDPSKQANAISDIAVSRFEILVGRKPTGEEKNLAAYNTVQSLEAQVKNAKLGALSPVDKYERLAGEVEARNTQSRQRMTAEQRRNTSPESTADIPASDVIVVFNGKEMRAAPVPANAAANVRTIQTVAAVKQATQALRNRWLGFRRIEIVQHDSDLPREFRDRVLRSGGELTGSEGWFDPKTKTVYLVADNLASPERAVWVAIHETVGHGGVRMLGKPVADALDYAAKNSSVSKLARAIAADRGEEFNAKIHTDEALAELSAATITGDVDAILDRYGVKVPSALRQNLIGSIQRIVEAVRTFMAKVFGRAADAVSDADVYGLLTRMREAVEGKAETEASAEGAYALASTSGKAAVARTEAFGKYAELIADFRNDQELKQHADYKAAKGGDIAAAVRLVSDLVKPESIAAAREAFGDDVAYLPVMALEASGKNQIPNALAAHYVEQAGGTLATGIFQTNKAFHTGADAMERLIARSEFGGKVIPGQKYVLVDDVSTMGGTLADMASYIQSQGGVVSGAVLLTNASRSGSIVPDAKIIRSLEARHGQAIRELFGVEPSALTRDESQYLIGFRTTDELRTRRSAASAERSRRILAKAQSKPAGSQAPVEPLASRAPSNDIALEYPGVTPPRQGRIPLQGGQSGSRASWDAPEASRFDDLVYSLQDKNIDMKRVVEAVKASGAELSEKFNPYLQEELFHGRSAKRTQDFVNTELKPLLTEMKARGLTMAELDEYLHARHAKEANALIAERDPDMADGGSGMTNQQADDYMAGLPADKKARLDAAAKKVDAIIARTRELYVSYGLVSRDQADSWAQMFEHYVPLMREDHDGGMGIGQGFSIKGKEVKHRTGSTAAVVDIFANIAMQREKAIVRGEKNRVAVALAGLAKLNPNPDFWTFDKLPVERMLNEATGLVEERINPTFRSRDNVVIAKIKDASGQVHERAVVFNERNERAMRMVQAIKNMDTTQLGGILGVSAKITRYFASINTQYNPVFGVVNLIRDSQAVLLNLSSTALSGHKAEVLKHIPSAMKGIYADVRAERQGHPASSKWAKLWEEMQDEGGMTGYRDLYRNSADRAEAIEHELDPHNWTNSEWGKVFTAGGMLKVPLTKAQDMAAPIFDWLSDYNLTMEGATRLAAYKVAIDNGMSKRQAASLAKNISVNFNRKGQSGQQAGALYAFFNAAMQGTARIGQTVFDMDGGDIKTLRLSKAGKTIVYGGMLLGSMQALALAAAGFDDDEPPEFLRERSLILPIGGKKYLTLPMPLGFHAIPNIGRIATEFMLGGFEKPADHVIKLIGVFSEAFNPIGSAGVSMQTIAPTAIDPFAALAENKDWTGKSIYKEDYNALKPTPGFSRNKDTASAWAKFLAEGINWATGGTDYTPGAFSPTADQIDYLAGQVTGGVGRELTKVSQTVGALATGEDLPTYKVPLFGRFYGDSSSQSSEGNAYYSNLKRINEVKAEIDGRREDGLPVDDYKADHPEWRLIGRAKFADNMISKLRKRKRELMERDAPRDQIRAIEDRITKEMKRLNDAVMEMEEREAA